LEQRTALFYQLLKFWYCDNPRHKFLSPAQLEIKLHAYRFVPEPIYVSGPGMVQHIKLTRLWGSLGGSAGLSEVTYYYNESLWLECWSLCVMYLTCNPSASTVSICIPPILLKIMALWPPSTTQNTHTHKAKHN